MRTAYTSKGKEYVNKVIAATDEALQKRVKWMKQRGWRLVAQYTSTTRFPLRNEYKMHLRFEREAVA